MLHLDFETCSPVELDEVGLHNYSTHPMTRVWCLGYKLPSAPVQMWIIDGAPLPSIDPYDADWHIRTLTSAISAGVEVHGWNVMFEYWIWNRVLRRKYPQLPALPRQNLRCTQAAALTMGLPQALADCGRVFAARATTPAEAARCTKDSAGHKVMLSLRNPGVNFEAFVRGQPIEKFAKMYQYCEQDVVVEHEVSRQLRPLTPQALEQWRWLQDVNDRGVHVDVESARNLTPIVDLCAQELSQEVAKLTGGAVTKTTQHKRLLDWCQAQGANLSSVGKPVREAIETGETEVPPIVRQVLENWGQATAGATGKLARIVGMAGHDSRIREGYQYHSAHTGRPSGKGVQLQNLKRPPKGWGASKAAKLFQIANAHPNAFGKDLIQILYGPPMGLIGGSVRALFNAAAGHTLETADLSAIESVVLAWAAGEQWKVDAHRQAFKGITRDVYVTCYARLFGVDPDLVDDHMRQIGKVLDLACGYEGWLGAWANMAKIFGLSLPEHVVTESILAWRREHSKTVEWWRALEAGAIAALRTPDTPIHVRPVIFYANSQWLAVKMPSNRVLYYMWPSLGWDHQRDKAQFHYYGTGLNGAWVKHSMYGGAWAENIVQAIAYDIFIHGGMLASERGLPIVLHTHDELTAEVPLDATTQARETLIQCMESPPPWCLDIPLKAKASGLRSRYWK